MRQRAPWIAPVVGAAVLLGVVVVVRHALRGPEHEFEPVAPVRTPLRGQRSLAGEMHALRGEESFDGFGDEAPRQRGSGTSAAKSIRPQKPVATPMHPLTVAGGAAPADQPADAAEGGPPGSGAASGGPALSVAFDGSATGADGAEPIMANGVDFDPTLGAARFPPTAALAYPDSGGVNTQEGTIVFWVHMEWDPSQPNISGKTLAELRTSTWENRIDVGMGPHFFGALFTNSDGVEQGVGTQIAWAQGEWHHVAVTWGDSVLSLYLDGALKDQRELNGTVDIPQGTPLYVGSTGNQGLRAQQGTVSLRNWQVFQRVLQPDELEALIGQTAPPTG